MIRRMLLLIAAGLAFILLAGLPVRYLAGDQALLFCGTAVLLCLLPGVMTMLWIHATSPRDPHQAALKLLAASGLRMFGVLCLAVLLYFQTPYFQGQDSFLFWVLGAYLYLLAVEVLLTVRFSNSDPSDVIDPRDESSPG